MADKIRTLGPGLLTIGSDDSIRELSADVTNVTLTPSNDSEDSDHYLDGHEEGGETTTTWELSGNIGEDYSMDGAQVWALNNNGKTLPFEFVPNIKGGIKWTGNVEISPVSMGGDVKSKNTNDFSFPVTNLQHEPYTHSVSQ